MSPVTNSSKSLPGSKAELCTSLSHKTKSTDSYSAEEIVNQEDCCSVSSSFPSGAFEFSFSVPKKEDYSYYQLNVLSDYGQSPLSSGSSSKGVMKKEQVGWVMHLLICFILNA